MKPGHLGKVLHRKWKAIVGAIEWRVRARLGDERLDAGIFRLGVTFRPRLDNTCFFGIAGSVGKTTTKDLLVSILKVRGKTIGNPQSLNAAPEVAKTILRTRPWHRYCVAELGESAPGSLDNQLAVLQPSIGIITVVGDDHLSAFGSRQAVAREFARLVQAVPTHGTVALNVDDELVSSLREDARGRVITYGTGASADLRATDIASIWPDSLQFTANFNGKSVPIRTQLFGKQLLTSALAAIAGGLAAGLTLEECATGISRVVPVEGRMQPVHVPGGINFIRDDFKAPAWTVRPLLDQLRDAKAHRKIFVLGTISDCRDTPTFMLKTAREALAVADIAIFTGHFASAALKARQPGTESRLHAFTQSRDVADFLQSIRQDGDLILLKGTNKKDHLSRIPLSLSQTVNCWVDDCGRDMFCSECSHLRSHRGPPGLITQGFTEPPSIDPMSPGFPTVSPTDPIIIGLGNPGPEFIGTPHNVGYDLLDHFGSSIASKWEEYPEAWIARGVINDCNLCLIKIRSPMNLTGSVLKKLSVTMHFDAAQCILVFDDIDLPLGKARTRMNGSSGGHRGVASILEAFQSDAFRRIKIGVGKPGGEHNRVAYVLTPFAAEDRPTIDQAVLTAEASLREMVLRPGVTKQHQPGE
ncbi:MAG: hypothetical protein JNK92_10230 [Dechloromonas sp.]|nr:hypothetical protein [Dechloromonas sp.]